MTDETMNWRRLSLLTVPTIIVIGDAIGFLSQSGFRNHWFDSLAKPFFMPPGWLFGVAWNILYALLGISLAIVLAAPRSSRRSFALLLFLGQLILNFAWSPIFFAGHDIVLAKWVIFIMAALAAAAAGQFLRIKRSSGLLMIPYLAWLVFAATLNATIDALNPGAGNSIFG